MAAQVLGTANSAAGNTVTIPAHAPGDLIMIFAYRDGNNATPTQPAAGGTVPTWNIVTNNTGGNTNSSRVSWALATTSTHTSGTWTNATGMVAVVVRGQRKFTPIGGAAEAGTTFATTPSSTANIAGSAVTQQDTTGEALLLQFFGARAVTAWGAAAAGYTRLTAVATEVACNRKDSSTTDGAPTQTCTTTASTGYRVAQVEILAHRPKHPGVFLANSPGLL